MPGTGSSVTVVPPINDDGVDKYTATLSGGTTVTENPVPGTVTLTVTLDQPVPGGTSIDFSIGGTATEGAAADYTYAPASPLVFGAAETTKDIILTINDDSLYEVAEDIIVSITTDANGVDAGSPQTVIINDDGDTYTATLSGGTTVTEDPVPGIVTLTVTLDQPVPGGAFFRENMCGRLIRGKTMSSS